MLRGGNKSLVSWRSARSCQRPIFIILLGFVVSIILLIVLGGGASPAIDDSIHNHVSESLESLVLPNPTMEFINGTQIIWQTLRDPKAVLFVAHGCGGTALNFWDRCPTCPKCVGLPEEKRIVLYALAQKFAVLVVTSTDTCWSTRKERLTVGQIIRWWLMKNELVKIPLFGLGASAGGYFLSVLATEVRFRGIVLMIASGLFDKMDNIPDDYPPTLFVHMPKDVKRGRKIDRHINILRKKSIEAREIKCMEFALTPNWLADRISALDQKTSSKLFKLLRDKSFTDAKGYMRKDGRVTPWREALKQSNILLPYGTKLEHLIEEELNLAYGYHEMTSLQSDQIFEWLTSHSRR